MSQSFLGSTFNQEKCEPHVDYRNKQNHFLTITVWRSIFPFLSTLQNSRIPSLLFFKISLLIVITCIYLYICTYIFLYITCSVHIILLFVCFLGWLFSPGKPSSVAFPPPAFLSPVALSSLYKGEVLWVFSYLVWHVWWHQPSSAHI